MLLAVLLSLSVCGVLGAEAAEDASVVEGGSAAEAGADFLQSMVRRMQHEKLLGLGEHLSDAGYRPTPLPHQYLDDVPVEQGHHDHHGQELPHPPLSKSELLALYQAAVAKGSGLNLGQLPALPLSGEEDHHQSHLDFHQSHQHSQHNQQHNQQSDQHSQHQDPQNDELVTPADQGTLPGYYYYFYPIKSFMPNGSADSPANMSNQDMMMMMMDGQGMSEDSKETRIDPLFLAMAGFVSMATIVSFSILFLPKFGDHRSHQKASLKDLPEDDDEMFSLTRVVGQAIQGEDCAERLACELGRAIRTMKLGQKPLRVIELMLPPQLAKQMSQVRQHMVKRERCQYIPCKRFRPTPKPKLRPKPNNKKP